MDECYPNDIEAVEYTELVRVDKIAFHNVISHYPEELKKMKARAKGMGKEQKRITKNLQNAKMVAMFGDEDAEEEEVEDPFVFHPDSTFRIMWDYISFALIMYNFVAVPLLIGFFTGGHDGAGIGATTLSTEVWTTMLIVDSAVDFFFVVDILLHARCFAYVDESGRLVKK